MDTIDALWYGAVTPGEVLEKQDEKQKALARLMERNRAELAALHREAGAILEKLAGSQVNLRQGKHWRQGVRISRYARNDREGGPAGLPQRLPPGHAACRRSSVQSARAL